MHQQSYDIMRTTIERELNGEGPFRVLDVGSQDVNGTYKPIFDRADCTYTGADISEGPNVDIVIPADGPWAAIEPNSYDVVISGQCLEHCRKPWCIASEIVHACKPGGLIVVIAPWRHQYHPYPIDCWRILADGMVAMMDDWARAKVTRCDMVNSDTVYVGRKPEEI